MLPSPRKAPETPAAPATDVGYIAENDVHDEMIASLETLITVTRELFGTNAWLPDGGCDFMGSFTHGAAWSGLSTPSIQSPRLSVRTLDLC